jgi:hypothetical protein
VTLEQEMEWQMAAYDYHRELAAEDEHRAEVDSFRAEEEHARLVHDAEQGLELAIGVLGIPGILRALAKHMTRPDPSEPF